MDKDESAEERVTDGDSARKGRIDLTQFEKLPKQMEIEWHKHPIYGERCLVQISEPEVPWVVGAVVPDFTPYDDFSKDKVEQERIAKMFAMSPELIAELKRTYDKIDVLEERLQFSEHIMETMHDEHYADLVMDFIEQAHPSKWCDWGHCRECQRLKKKASQ